MDKLKIIRPDDWHLHLRDGVQMKAVLPDTANRFSRAIVMPNLTPPITTVEAAKGYRERILAALIDRLQFEPLMTIYLTESTTPNIIRQAQRSGFVHAVKYYPAGATTHSDLGVANIVKCYPVFEEMEKCDLPLLIHGEVTDPGVDVFDREKVFIDTVLVEIIERFPHLRVVLEHITTREAVQFVKSTRDKVGATITAHHLLLNRNALFTGGIRPHHYCLPILKREFHRNALIAAAISGDSRFFLGTDSAPHARNAKESGCGCAGIYTAHAAIELYAEVFDQAGALHQLERFSSLNGPDFYRLPRNTETVELERKAWRVPNVLEFGDDLLVPFRSGEQIAWRLSSMSPDQPE